MEIYKKYFKGYEHFQVIALGSDPEKVLIAFRHERIDKKWRVLLQTEKYWGYFCLYNLSKFALPSEILFAIYDGFASYQIIPIISTAASDLIGRFYRSDMTVMLFNQLLDDLQNRTMAHCGIASSHDKSEADGNADKDNSSILTSVDMEISKVLSISRETSKSSKTSTFKSIPIDMELTNTSNNFSDFNKILSHSSSRIQSSAGTCNDDDALNENECLALPGLIGLQNSGGDICYLNSILQVLGHNKNLRNYVVTQQFANEIINKRSTTKGRVIKEFGHVISGLFSETTTSLHCGGLRDELKKVDELFEKGQQDAHEAFTFLINALHADTRTEKLQINIENSSENAWFNACKGKSSFFLKEFYGQFQNTLSCKRRHQSITYENFSSINLEILKSHSSSIDLIDCLKSYFSPTEVTSWDCEECNGRQKATKSVELSKLPNTLVIQLKRFSNQMRKNDDRVNIPFELNMKQFCADKSRDYRYKLMGIVDHDGELESGHYISFCEFENEWYLYNDENVTAIDRDHINDLQNAYLVVYELVSIIKVFIIDIVT